LLSEGERPSLSLTRFGIVTLSILSQLLFGAAFSDPAA